LPSSITSGSALSATPTPLAAATWWAPFGKFQELGYLEIITSAATHALLPLLADHPPSLRAQIMVARDHYRSCFGREPRGIWLPECAYVESLETVLQEANLRWFVTDTHGILHAGQAPRYGTFAPIFTPNGIAAFGRDADSARQVWSRHAGYPGDARYRDFYRDIGFDLDLDYVKPHLPALGQRGFTGIKYYRITGSSTDKEVYDRPAAIRAADEHAGHFLDARMAQFHACRKSSTARPSWWRPTTPSCSATGGMKARSSLITLCAKRAATRRCLS
jgi:1,4-alpha-glucan branching enzyme